MAAGVRVCLACALRGGGGGGGGGGSHPNLLRSLIPPGFGLLRVVLETSSHNMAYKKSKLTKLWPLEVQI